MEKYAVVETEDEKRADADEERCPECGGILEKDVNIKKCLKCGTKPFEPDRNHDLKNS